MNVNYIQWIMLRISIIKDHLYENDYYNNDYEMTTYFIVVQYNLFTIWYFSGCTFSSLTWNFKQNSKLMLHISGLENNLLNISDFKVHKFMNCFKMCIFNFL